MSNLSKYRVHPGLSVRSDELKRRLALNQPIPGNEGIYHTPDELTDLRKMSRADIAREKLENESNIVAIKDRLARAARTAARQDTAIPPAVKTQGDGKA